MLTNYERETIITFNEAEADCEVYTYNQKLIRKLTERCESHPSLYRMIAEDLYVKRVVVHDDYVRIELHNVPGSLKGNDARLTDDSEPCDVHMILARFSRKKIHAFIPRDKNVSKIGGGEEN